MAYLAVLGVLTGIPVLGALAGRFVPLRLRWLALAAVLLALAAWLPIWFHDDADYYDIGRNGALVIDGIGLLVAIGLWTAGLAAGRATRRRRSRAAAEGQ